MKKRLFAILLISVIMCLSLTGCSFDLTTITVGDLSLDFKVEDGSATLTGVPDKTVLNHIIIPDEYEGVPVEKIADFAAVNLENVTEITIGKNIKEISTWAFENNQELTAFHVDKENPYFCDVDGVIYTKDMKTVVFYPPAKGQVKNENGKITKQADAEYEIADTVETIRTKAFYRCSNLEKITIPESVTVIEEKAFLRCSIKELILPEKLKFIGKDAFSFCTNVSEVTIHGAIEEIGEYAFYNCNNLKKVTVEKKETDITLGNKWYPTNNGLEIDELIIEFK